MVPLSKANSDDAQTRPEPSFEQAFEKLEAIVHRLEEGELPLAEALSHYEQGVACLRRCYQLLEAAEQRIELLMGVDAQGQATTAPFDPQASYEPEEIANHRPQRRKAARHKRPVQKPPEPDQTDMDEPGQLF